MTLRTFTFRQELLRPFLSVGTLVALHHVAQVFDDAVEGHEIVARRVNQFLVDAHILQRAIQNLVHGIVRNLFDGRVQRLIIFLEDSLNLPENQLVLVFSQGHDTPFADGGLAVGYHLAEVDLAHHAQALASWTGTLWRVKREHIRCRVTIRDARGGAHQFS